MADFVQPVNALFMDKRLTDGDRTVYCLLLSFADYGTLANCRPSVGTVAKRGNRDRSTVVRALAKLVELGWVSRQARKTADGDSDTSLYSFPFQVVGAETHLPRCTGASTVGAETHLGVGAQTHHNLEPVHQEPITESVAPAVAAAPALQLTLAMPKPVKAPRTINPRFAAAMAVCAMWKEIMTDQTEAVARLDNMAVLAKALEVHGEEKLRALMTWAHTDEWHSGRKGSKTIRQWMSTDNLAKVVKDRENASKGRAAPQPESVYREYKPRPPRPTPPKEQP